MTDPALDGVVFALLTGTGIALAVVLVLLGVARLVRRRPSGHAIAPVEPIGPAEQDAAQEPVEEPAAHEGAEVEVPEPRDPAEAPAATEVVLQR